MKIVFAFDSDKVVRGGYTMDTVYHTIKKNFAVKHLLCVADGVRLAFADSGEVNDFSGMWAIIMALLRTDWFVSFAVSCVLYDDDGSEEDVLSQAWKVREKKVFVAQSK